MVATASKPNIIWSANRGGQSLFLACPFWEALADGDRGGGKTTALLQTFLKHVGKGHGEDWRGILFRLTYKQLKDVIDISKVYIKRAFPGAKYNKSDSEWNFPDGEVLMFRYLENLSDYDNYHGHSYPWLGFEELCNWPNAEPYEAMLSCSRWRSANANVPRMVRATTNSWGVGHCVPYGDVLTLNGWVPIQNLKVGDHVYSVDKEGQLIDKIVGQVHRHWYDGELCTVDKRGISIVCTPGHSVPKVGGTRLSRFQKFTLTPMDELPANCTILRTSEWDSDELKEFHVPYFRTRKTRLSQPSCISGDDFCELVGWVISEGYVVDRDKAFGISQMKREHRDTIRELLDRCGFSYGESHSSFLIHSPSWWAYFREFGSKSFNKSLPRWILRLPARQLRILFHAAMLGDGHYSRDKNSGGIYYTSSCKLADDMSEVAFKIGYCVYQMSRQRECRETMSYQVNFKPGIGVQVITGNMRYNRPQKKDRITKPDIRRQPYAGFVYDIGVDDTHTFVIRQNGSVWVSGNSWVKQRFVNGKLPYKPYGEAGRQRIRIPTYWKENLKYVAADPDYHVRLAESITNEAQRKAWLENSWDIVAGGRFSDVWKESTHFIEPFNIPNNWRVDRSFDWGSSKPFCTLWYAESNGESIVDGRSWPKGTLFVIGEDYGCAGDMNDANWKPDVGIGLDPVEIAKRGKGHEEDMLKWGLIGRRPQPGPADDPMFDVSRGTSMAKQMANERWVWIKPSKGKGSRVTGWQMIDQRLKASTKHPMEEPGLFIFNTCVHLRRTLPILPRDAKNPDDVDTTSEDHAADSLRLRLLAGIKGHTVREVHM